MGEPFENVKFQFAFTAQPDATYVSNPVKSKAIESFIFNPKEQLSKTAIENLLNGKEQDDYTTKKQAVLDIITNDPAAPKNLDKEKMTAMIMQTSQETGVDPVVLASIAKQESHFKQDVPTSCGSGIMQLTTISIKDMYLRPKIYDKSLRPILLKYGSPEMLVKAMRRDPELNLKLGAVLYKAKLAQAKGDEKKALELYNGSPIKKKYAQAVMNNINVVRETTGFNTSA